MGPDTSAHAWPIRPGRPRRALTWMIVLLVGAASTPTFAHSGGGGGGGKGHSGGHHVSGAHSGGQHIGGRRVGIGVIVAAPAFYPPLPYYPPDALAPSGPPVYIEQGTSTQDRPAGYWYYCADAKAYYPYVNECAVPWQPVAPLAPQGQ